MVTITLCTRQQKPFSPPDHDRRVDSPAYPPGQRCITRMGKKGWGRGKEVCKRLGGSSARSLMASGAATWRTG